MLRSGILAREDAGQVADVRALRDQWERMKRMLGSDGEMLESLPPPPAPPVIAPIPTHPISMPLLPLSGGDRVDVPYSDEPPPSPTMDDPVDMLQTQRQMMDDQDTHLDMLSQSINRQRDISEQMGSELQVHHGLLEDLEEGLDRTAARMSGASRRLDRVAKGARDNLSTVTIGALIAILLMLIIIFKT